MVKVKTVITDSDNNPNIQSPSVTREVLYRHGAMRRRDNLETDTEPYLEDIANCEARTGFLVDLAAHQYKNYKVVKFLSESERIDYLRKTGRPAVLVETKTVDTGERKPYFGYSAKHLITTAWLANVQDSGEETIDGWYIDHEGLDRSCAPDFVRTEPYYVVGTGLVMYPDVAQVQHTGPLPTGLAVVLKLTDKRAATKDGSSK
jgi:hypothetical protein